MRGGMDKMSQACDNYDLTISTKKNEVEHQPALGKPYSEPTITLNGDKLQVVDNFANLSRIVQIDDKVAGRTTKASVVLVDFVQMSGSEMESDFTLI